MKKGIISLVLIAAILLSTITAMAYVSGIFNFGGGQLSQGRWDLTSGSQPYMAVGDDGVYSPSNSISIATHPVSVESGGSYTCTFKFRINDLSSDVLVGIGSSSGQTLAGYNGRGSFIVGGSGVGGTPSASAEYTVQFTSINDNSFNVKISGSGIDVTQDVTGSMPTSVVMRITNASDVNGPVIRSATFTSAAAPTATPSVSPEPSNEPSVSPTPSETPSVTPSPSTAPTYNRDMADWYAAYYYPPVLSNQSYIYDDNGKLVKIVTGKPGSEVVAAAEPLNMTAPAVGNVTARAGNVSANVTKNSTMPTVMPETTVPAATTKTQSPGFEAILAAISMVAALFYFGRKK